MGEVVMPFVTDTHPLAWYMTDDIRLSSTAKKIFDEESIFIPCIVLFELLYIIEKKKINIDFDNFINIISLSENYNVEPLCLPIIEKSIMISRKEIPDPWDRLIVATSLYKNLPLITRDKSLRKIGLEIIW